MLGGHCRGLNGDWRRFCVRDILGASPAKRRGPGRAGPGRAGPLRARAFALGPSLRSDRRPDGRRPARPWRVKAVRGGGRRGAESEARRIDRVICQKAVWKRVIMSQTTVLFLYATYYGNYFANLFIECH